MGRLFSLMFILLTMFYQVAAETQREENLVAYYPFQGNVLDHSGNGHHGTVEGATLTDNRFGVADRAYYFSSCNLINCGDPPDNSFDIGEELTLTAWISLASTPPGPGSNVTFSVIGKDIWNGPNVSKWILGLQQNRLIFHINGPGYGSGYWIFSNNSPMALNNWYHVAMTKSGSEYTFYLDGVHLGDRTMTQAIYDVAAPMTIGCAEPSSPHHGDIDEVRFYNRRLSPNEIMDLYQGPAAPLQVTISYNAGNIRLDWLEVEAADYYRVYSSTDPETGFSEESSGTFDGTSWETPLLAGPRFYRLTAVRD